ncbi:hypothetical protein, partial [Paenibacillus glycanilyticus]|uniref:hypothetical protein n=1 Tax=Paenibacillus glycanilyticus TaxID=126569 RepID=UPI00295EAE16
MKRSTITIILIGSIVTSALGGCSTINSSSSPNETVNVQHAPEDPQKGGDEQPRDENSQPTNTSSDDMKDEQE